MQKGAATVFYSCVFSITSSLRLVFLIPQWWWIQSLHWSLYLCENQTHRYELVNVCISKEQQADMWLSVWLDLMETVLCVSFSCSPKSLCKQQLQSRTGTSTVRWVCVSGVRDRAGECFPHYLTLFWLFPCSTVQEVLFSERGDRRHVPALPRAPATGDPN